MMKAVTDPTMNDSCVEFFGVRLHVDPIDRRRTENSDNVMAIFWEEQPATWMFARPYIETALREVGGTIDFLDVGTGSGVFAILMAKHFNVPVYAVDKSTRAVELAGQNAKLNGVRFAGLLDQSYSPGHAPRRSVKVVGFNPPYHLYPESVAVKIPQHARGGSDGQEELRNQLAIANEHLADRGIIFFNMMCLGDENGPAYLEYIPQYITGFPSIFYTNVFPPMCTNAFLRAVYGNRHSEYVEKTVRRFPKVYYTVGVIRRDGRGDIEEVQHALDLRGRTWADRIGLHQSIAEHEWK